MGKLRVWVNFDPKEVPLAGLQNSFGRDPRFEYIEERIEDREAAIAAAEKCDILINTFDQLDSEVLERLAGKIKLIVRYGTGYERVDIARATELGIPVANCPGANAPAVAELALIHILNCGRHFAKSIKTTKEGIWPGSYSGSELNGKTVGLWGYGNIAQQLSRMLGSFDLTLLAYDPFISQEGRLRATEFEVNIIEDLDEFLTVVDILSIHIPLHDQTRSSVNADVFDKVKDGLIVINTSRGPVIDEAALLHALGSGRVKAAGLDVLTEDPPSLDNPLLNHRSVYVTSHIGASTYESEMRTQAMIYETVNTFLSGSFSFNVINREALAS